jgi:hypothetical protein
VWRAAFVAPIDDTEQLSYRLRLIPERLQGRVNSVYRLAADGAKSLGVAAVGFALEWVGAVPTILASAALLAVLAALTMANRGGGVRVRMAWVIPGLRYP